ncbi:hypothetical protein BDM02DRAFT_3263577 [Thelephora ganbajun]|uniref:Uncharacterized protein n=1 Tax=Thelephora ganbajun TaxID=370292 RepID=A0ACB6Z518_THEGA|nr:hypothetical protein BDM02DRAFT_3263577 [Thelephora ganbajun]
MSANPGYHNRQALISSKIRSLFLALTNKPLEYNQIAPKIEYWIKYVLCERFTTIDELVEAVSHIAWNNDGSYANIGRFLKEFHDAPHRSEHARSFVAQLCLHVLQWFAIASLEDLWNRTNWGDSLVSIHGGESFIHAASSVGHLIEWGLLKIVRANAIYQLFIAAGNTLLQGLLEAEDVRVCFGMLDAQALTKKISGFDAAKLKELREIHAAWMQRKQEEEQGNVRDIEGLQAEGRDAVATEVETPIAFVSQYLPAAMIDGNVEIVCGDTVFRVHSTIVSFSSPNLRDILSQPALLRAQAPEGPPRITIPDSPEDFGILLKMIYTPGFPARHEVPEFTVFASLLRMTTKYGFFDVRDQLIKDLKSAYPTKWEDYRTAKVLGEDVFGSPKPHPNAVLNLFEVQNIRFAIPFAAYCASIGGFLALISDKPGTVLPRHTLATTIHGMHVLQSVASHVARVAAYEGKLWVCPNDACALNAGISPIEKKLEAMGKIYEAMVGQRKGGVLSTPSLEHLFCPKCTIDFGVAYAGSGSVLWEKLPSVFTVSHSWDGL